jgi:hypothetical protein
MIIFQAALSIASVHALRWLHPVDDPTDDPIAAAGPAVALMIALGFASIAKSRLLSRILGAPVSGWRWSLLWASAGAGIVGWLFTRLPHRLEWVELVVGVPLILATYGVLIWYFGFGEEDRELFRMKPAGAPAV